MTLGIFEEAPRFTTVWAPPAYRATAAGPVRYAAVKTGDQVAGYAWVAPDEDAADFLATDGVDEDGFEAAVWWVERLREACANRRSPTDAFEYWMEHAPRYGMAVGEAREAESLPALYELAGRRAEDAPRQQGPGPRADRPPLFLPMSPSDYADLEDAFRRQVSDPRQEREIERMDELLAARPVPEDLIAWRNASRESFNLDWQYLPGTLQRDPAYLAVAMTRFNELETAEVVLHLRVAAGIPAVYMNAVDREAPLPAPSLLLRRGLSLRIHDVRRRGEQWYVQAAVLPPSEDDPDERGGGEGDSQGGNGEAQAGVSGPS